MPATDCFPHLEGRVGRVLQFFPHRSHDARRKSVLDPTDGLEDVGTGKLVRGFQEFN